MRRHDFHECFQDDALHCWHQKCLQLRSRNSSHVSSLVSIVLRRKSATNLGHCPFSARNCRPSLDHTSLTWTRSAAMSQSFDHVLDQYMLALLACNGSESITRPHVSQMPFLICTVIRTLQGHSSRGRPL